MSPPVAETTPNAPGDRLDSKAARQAFDRAARADRSQWAIAKEIAGRMAERLDFIRLEPRHILDAGCGQVPAAKLLMQRFPSAGFSGLDASFHMAKAARSNETWLARARSAVGLAANRNIVCGEIESLPFADASVDMVWSNLALAWVRDPEAAFSEFHRVLKEGGLLMFSTYGPDTLRELRSAFAAAESGPHVHTFIDMHDLGDMLLAKGFAEPVMDMDKLVCTYANVTSLLHELKQGGQTNVLRDRGRGLLGRSAWNALLAAYPQRVSDGRIEATFEIVYGHAWKVRPRLRGGRSPGATATVQWMPELNSGVKR